MRVVLSMIVKDSVRRLGEGLFMRVLKSSLQVPYGVIVLVDDGSDSTAEAVRRFADAYGKELIAERSRLPPGWARPTRATARQTAIDVFLQSTSDEWLFFLDDDCVLNDGWWRWAVLHGVLDDPEVGEVWGINWDAFPERERFLKALGIDLKAYLIKKFEERGGTHDTLYRRAALEGVKIPPEHIYEDAWLHFHVKCRGWRHAVNPVGVAHFHVADVDLKAEKEKLRLAIELTLKYGISEYRDDMLRAAARGIPDLLRPVAGFVPMLITAVRVYGLRRGAVEAAKRQYLKLWFRWQALRLARGRRLPDPCEAVGCDVAGGCEAP